MSTRVAIAFDIDGVFKYGREWSADGLSSLQKATQAKIPYVFVTNGGGGRLGGGRHRRHCNA